MPINETTEQNQRKELLKQAFLKIQDLQQRLEEKDRGPHGGPIAIIGMGCRFPGGAHDPENFWKILSDGVDTVSEIPPDRWDVDAYFDAEPGADGKMYSRHGAFLSAINQFDPHFFGISPREAEKMDPQQRLLLEVVWEALESAGQTSEALHGSATGVYVALNGDDYAHLMSRAAGSAAIDLYFGTGVARSIAAGRISYTLGLKGPCISLDTACSGSLAAVHLACQSLRMQECHMAVAGGVTLIITPDGHLIGSKGQMLSPDGKCKTFDASADGYVRGEGCGIVVLKRLADAQREKDPILAIIRGTALNQDGRSSGMTAPNGLAQEDVIRAALSDAGIDALAVGYVETHGTGTILGDPIEVLALGNTYGALRSRGTPVIIGAVKTNIGHLEAAAGIAGLIKTVLILQHGRIPPNLHFQKPNPHIPWEKLAIQVADRSMPWPSPATKRIAAVSSFGFSGTNAHLVIEGAGQQEREAAQLERPLHILALSAKTDAALDRLAHRYAEYCAKHPDRPAGDFCFTANTGRAHQGQRLACIGSTWQELGQALAAGRVAKGAARTTTAPPVAFRFCGWGHRNGHGDLGRGLFETQPVFRRTLTRCSQILSPYLPLPLIDLLYPRGEASAPAGAFLDQPSCFWPAAFSLGYALHAMLQSWGLQPTVVLGDGPGEYVAACAAEVFSLETGLALAAERGKWLQNLSTADDFRRTAAGMQYTSPRVDVVSAVTGSLVEEKDLRDPEYWGRPPHSSARMPEAIRFLEREGYGLLVEIGPDATSAGKAMDPPTGMRRLPLTSAGPGPWPQLLESLAQLYVQGAGVDWHGFDRDYGRARVPLPTYPFQRDRYWFSDSWADFPAEPQDRSLHPLLGRRVAFAKSEAVVFESCIDTRRLPFLLEHRIFETAPFPATALLEMGQAAAAAIAGPGHHWIEEFAIHAPLMVEAGTRLTLQTVVELAAAHEGRFEIFSLKAGSDDRASQWTLHAVGKMRLKRDASEKDATEWEDVRKDAEERCAEIWSGSQFYAMLRLEGVDYGPAFQGLAEIRRGSGEALGRIRIPAGIAGDCPSYHIHPAVLDSCLQLMGAALLGKDATPDGAPIFLPMGLEHYSGGAPAPSEGWIHAAVRSGAGTEAQTFTGDVRVFAADGQSVARLIGLRFKRADKGALQRVAQHDVTQWLYALSWQALPNPAANLRDQTPPGMWWIVSAHRPLGQALAAELNRLDVETVCLNLEQAASIPPSGAAPEGIVYLSGGASAGAPAPAFENDAAQDCFDLLRLVQAMASAAWDNPPQLFVATCGAAAVDARTAASDLHPAQAALWGLGRVITAEHPEWRCTLVDLDPAAGMEDKIQQLAAECRPSLGRENQLALRQNRRLGLRLVRCPVRNKPPEKTMVVPSGPYQLEIAHRGVIDNLAFHPLDLRPPGPGEVQIEVEATGLNFRDVLNALGMYPGDPGALGNECVGRIAALGSGVLDLHIGQPVLALSPQAFCSHVNVRHELVAPRPESISVEAAATIPMAFLTAEYALHYLGRMQSGERVLIHAAAGGVGMAAVQLAKEAGAEIFATAGSEEKRALLKSLGIRHVMDSRTLDFAEQIDEATDGQGIDIVLNSLAGDFIPRSLARLRTGGRFLELGKTDLWDQERAAQVNPAATFIPVFLGDICRQQPALVKSMFRDLMQGFADGRWAPLPHRLFPVVETQSAFRFMAQARHIGKVVVDQRSPRLDRSVRGDATYLITGGLGALGLHFARWLADKGARRLVLLGRRPAGPAAQKVIEHLRAAGVGVTIAQADVSKEPELRRVFDQIAALPPLKGIIHAAGRVDDGMLRNLQPQQFVHVMAPKVTGTRLLHTLTQGMDLDFFVLCSAGAALFGSPGQGNYAAANAFMDALAHYRRSLGLPALSINWGPWAGGGMADALDTSNRHRWKSQGMGMIEPQHGTRALELAMDSDVPQIAVLPMQWPVYFQQVDSRDVPAFLSALAASEHTPVRLTPAVQAHDADGFLERLANTDPENRRDLLLDYLRDQAIGVLGLRSTLELNLDEGLTDMGMDSLMAVEFSNRLKRALGRHLPSTLAFEHPTLRALADHLAKDILRLEIGGSGIDAPEQRDARPTLQEVAGLSESAAEKDLLQELERSGY
jgi:acyl transferase domain-containing protein/NADPH:quinone reductase-like Zn-dependent oxidoreductase/short-subunit dehydrogenase